MSRATIQLMLRRTFRFAGLAGCSSLLLLPTMAFSEVVKCINSYSTYQTKTYTLPPNTLNPGANQHNSLQTNATGARGDIGKTYFTIELTSFRDTMCAGGPCRNNVPGIAHRTWPLGSCVAVCNTRNKKCAVSIVMDRGPNSRLGCRTIDANPALQTALEMRGGTVPATYQLLSVPPKTCEQVGVPTINVEAPPHVTVGRQTTPFGTPVMVPRPVGVPFPGSQAQVREEPYCIVSTEPLIVYPYPCSSIANRGNILPAPQSVPSVARAPTSIPTPAPTPPSIIIPPSFGLQPPSPAPRAAVPSAALVIAQPSSALRGHPITISWASVGMRSAEPCGVAVNGSILASSNEGTKVMQTTPQSPATLTIVLSCSPQSGGTLQKSTRVTLHSR